MVRKYTTIMNVNIRLLFSGKYLAFAWERMEALDYEIKEKRFIDYLEILFTR
jgi:hypothetical protein